MSVKLMSMVFDAQGITSTQKLVLLALADHAADDGTSIYPSIETVASKTCLSETAVRKALRELRGGLALIRIARRFTSRMPNKYAINIPNLSALKRVSPENTQDLGVSPKDTQGVTKRHPRVSPRDTDPSLTIYEPSGQSKIKTNDIKAAFSSCVNYPINWAAGSGSAAKWLAENGYTPDDVIGCYKSMAADSWWADKQITLKNISVKIGAWKSNNTKQVEKELVFS